MPTYNYIVTNQQGKKEEGSITAENRQNAAARLEEQKLIILALNEKNTKGETKRTKISLSRGEKLMFTKHLSTMISAGLTITEALNIMLQQKPSKNLRKLLTNLITLVKGGQNLASALEYHQNTFSPIFINMIKVGEEGGNLDQALFYMETQLQKDDELIKKIKGAMIYPVVILSVTISLALFLIAFIMPKITRIFSSFKVNLPLPTRILMATNEIMKAHGLKLLLAAIALVFFLRWLKNRNFVKPYTHLVLLKTPIIGKISRYANIARFSRILSSLLKSGVPLVKSLDIISKTLQNVHYQKALFQAKNRTQNGESLGQALMQSESLFPALVNRMIQVGEKTGTLEKTAENLAVMFERDVDDLTKNLSTLAEPFLLLIMGVVVGGIALSMIAPIYQIPQLIQR